AGLRVPGVEVQDFFTIPPEELAPRLVHDMNTILPFLPEDPHDVDFTVARYRETRTTAIITWDQPYDRVLAKWLGRVDTPTLIVWGDDDKLVPPALAPGWAAKLPNARVETFSNADTSCSTSRRTHATPWRAFAHRDADVRGAAARPRRCDHELDLARARRVRGIHRHR